MTPLLGWLLSSSAITLAGGRIPTVMVEIEPCDVVGVGSWETDMLHIFCLLTDC